MEPYQLSTVNYGEAREERSSQAGFSFKMQTDMPTNVKDPGHIDFSSFNFRRDLDPEVVAERFEWCDWNVSKTLRHLKRVEIIPESMTRYKLKTFLEENSIS